MKDLMKELEDAAVHDNRKTKLKLVKEYIVMS